MNAMKEMRDLLGNATNLDGLRKSLGLDLAAAPPARDGVFSTLAIFAAGLAIGAGLALLLAPQTGEELRADLATRLNHTGAPDPDAEPLVQM